MLIKRNKNQQKAIRGGKSMLIKTNKTKELVESKLGIDFEEFKLVGCREISALTLIYKKNNELYVIRIANNIISSISKILSINERDNFSKLFLKNKMIKYESKFLMIYDFYFNEKDKIFIFNEDNNKVYDVYESESPLTLDKTEMTMIKMLGNFIDEEEIGLQIMLVSGEKIRKKIEDKFDFKFKNLQIIGYLNRNKYSNGKIFDTIICKNRENIYMIEICNAKIEIVKKIQYIGVDNTASAFTFFFNREEFYYKYSERIVLIYDEENTKAKYIDGYKGEIIYVGNEELKLADEEMVTLKLCNYFVDEKKLFGNQR